MNRLHGQTSPYLLRHASDPVDWHPWDAQALALAQREDLPILLSIGYSASHWCHVMARDSFQDAATAALMNAHFVNVLVDREERPDLDRVYQSAHQVLTRRHGGWPLTLFLDPHDRVPFFAGTYFPAASRDGLPGFAELLARIAELYRSHREQLGQYKTQMSEALARAARHSGGGEIDAALVDRACAQLHADFDETHGGFGSGAKFSRPSALQLLLDAAACTEDQDTAGRLLYVVDYTLAAMARGGLYDHLGGGFHHYCADPQWNQPHFEKMLCDNAALLALYARRAEHTAAPWCSEVAHATADWMLRELRDASGGMCTSLDADSESEAGRYYLWTAAEFRAAIGDDGGLAGEFGLTDRVERAPLRRSPPVSAAASANTMTPDQWTRAREQLLAVRMQRTRPARDDKILCGWNGLAVSALSSAGRILGRADCISAAGDVLDFLRGVHWRGDSLLACSVAGTAYGRACLDDYVLLLDGLLAQLQARWRNADLLFARQLADALLRYFEDRERGGFYFTAHDHELLLQRAKPYADELLPAGNAVAARALLELGHLIEESRYVEAALRGLRAGMGDAARAPAAHASLMSAMLDHVLPPPQLIVRSRSAKAATAWLAMARARMSERMRCYDIPGDAGDLPGALAGRAALSGCEVTTYLCHAGQCHAPVTTLAEFSALLDRLD